LNLHPRRLVRTAIPPRLENAPAGRGKRHARWLFRAGRWLFLLGIAGYLLFAHGCHGDEDTELFARLASLWR
jgi:hypothetical protein